MRTMVLVDEEDVATALAALPYPNILNAIIQVDALVADMDFTRDLMNLAKRLYDSEFDE